MAASWTTPGTYSLPVGAATSLTFDIAGAAGGSGQHIAVTNGGKGGRLQATLAVTPGETLTLIVGARGAAAGTDIGDPAAPGGTGGCPGGPSGIPGSPYIGGSGGGSTRVMRGGTVLLEAGAGAGAGADTNGGDGGGNGAGVAGVGVGAGQPGTGSSGGAAGGAGGATAGSATTGGAGGNAGGGGGGGGHFGGGGGAASGTSSQGGGGGSGYADASATGVTGTDGYQTGDGYVVVAGIIPNAPAWQFPTDGVSWNTGTTHSAEFTFSSNDSIDAQSAREWEYSTDGGTTWTSNGKESTSSGLITFAAAAFTAGATQVRARTWGQHTLDPSPWSAALHVTFADDPDAPEITSPTDGSTLDSASVAVTWSMTGGQGYQLKRVAKDGAGNPDLSTVYFDTGQVTSTDRALLVTFETNNRDEFLIMYGLAGGVWSSGYSQALVHVEYSPPPLPSIALTEDPAMARIIVTLATAAPGAGQVAAVSATLEARSVDTQIIDWSRTGAAVSLNGDTVHAVPTVDVDYEYRATTYAASGATASTAWIGSATGTPDDDSPLLDSGTPSEAEGALL